MSGKSLSVLFAGGQCVHCGRLMAGFSRKNITRHERGCAENPNRKRWFCLLCVREFPFGSGLLKHSRSIAHKNVCVEKGVSVAEEREVPQYARKPPVLLLGAPRSTAKAYDADCHPLLAGMPVGKFSVLLVDPPFRYDRRVGSGVADNHYATMADEDLRAMPVRNLTTEDALLFLWCSGPTLPRAASMCEAWGFKYKTIAFVWVKTNDAGTPKGIGLGYYTRPGTEFVIVATRGAGKDLITKKVDQVFAAPRRKHSEKPDEMRTMVHMMTGENPNLKKIELFSRREPDATWSVWGDEITENRII